jgi:hypothetical protein
MRLRQALLPLIKRNNAPACFSLLVLTLISGLRGPRFLAIEKNHR